VNLDDEFKALDDVVYSDLAEDAVFNGVTPARVIIDKSVDSLSADGDVFGRHTELSFRKSEVAQVSVGDTFNVSGRIYTVSLVVEDDGSEVTVEVR